MNTSENAKKGFKTFILTLSISLVIFSAVYYVLSTYSPDKKASDTQVASNESRVQEVQGASTTTEVADASVTTSTQTSLPAPSKEIVVEKDTKSVFADLAKKNPGAKPMVLAGSTSAPQSTTASPNTGVVEITIGLSVSLVLFLMGMVYLALNPRKMALDSFEKRIVNKL